MNLLPTTPLADADVADALERAVATINPLLDVLWGTDPLDLKRRPGRFDTSAGPVEMVADGVAWALNTADVPGTSAWEQLSVDARIDWWVKRVGAVNTIAVAFPGVLGVIGRRLPVQDLLGFVSQAIVLCAVARELGVTERTQQVHMLAAVLCDRELADLDRTHSDIPAEPVSCSPLGVIKAMWRLAGLLDAISDEVAKRPQPRSPFQWVSLLPGVGAVAAYLGENGALRRAATAGRKWIAAQPHSAVR